jgi:K+-transporting ATPase c subunit
MIALTKYRKTDLVIAFFFFFETELLYSLVVCSFTSSFFVDQKAGSSAIGNFCRVIH